MKTFFCSLFFALCFLFSEVAAQVVFNKAYDIASDNDYGHVIIQTLDGGYLLVANTTPSSLVFLKIDNIGDTAWTKLFDFSVLAGDLGDDLIQLSDSSYIICGTTQDTSGTKPDAFLFKITQNGDSLWLRRYGGTGNDYGDGVQQTADGGFLILGTTYSFTNGGMDAMVIKTDSSGNQEWLEHYGGSSDDVPKAGSLIKTQDGGFAFTGAKGMLGNSGMWLVKLDSNGNKLWDTTYAMTGDDDGANSIAQTLDGGFVLVGYTYRIINEEYDGYIAKTDSIGNLEWQKQYSNGVGTENTFIGIIQLSDSSYIVAGNPCFADTPNCEGLLIKLSPSGDSIWSKTYTIFGNNNNDYVYDMIQASDGGFVLCGMVTNYGAPTKQDIWLVKTDCMGNIDKWDSVACPLNVGVKEFEVKSLQVEVYPNPFSDKTTIKIMNTEQGIMNYEVKIYDVLGREVKHLAMNPYPKGDGFEAEIKAVNLPDGIYFYLLKGNYNVLASGKLVVTAQ